MSRVKVIELGRLGDTLTVEGTRAGVILTLDAGMGPDHASSIMLREQAVELRDALNAILGQPHVTGDEVHQVASVARDLALEEAAKLADHGGTEGQSSHLTAKYVAECIRRLKRPSNG